MDWNELLKVPPFRTVNFDDQVQSRFQDNVGVVLNALNNAEILNYVLIKMSVPANNATDIVVAHGLQRPARGFLLVSTDKPVVFYLSPSDKMSTTKIILQMNSLVALSNSINVTLLIF